MPEDLSLDLYAAPSPNGRANSADGKDIIKRKHPEYIEHRMFWRWMCDSLEGSNRYRQAAYGYDYYALPIRNMVRHKREYPDPNRTYYQSVSMTNPVGADPLLPATDDDYELRRARTPVPTYVPETVDSYLGKIYARKVKREAAADARYDPLRAWWLDVDGRGTTIDRWMCDTVGRLLLTCGQLDLQVVQPAAPQSEAVLSRWDEMRYGLDAVVARVILPQNLPYWRLNLDGSYAEAMVKEWPLGSSEDDDCWYRVWHPDRWVLYDSDGKRLQSGPHSYGLVPIVRVFCRRNPRTENCGMSLAASVAERQREAYNRGSELILSDTLHAHPVLQAPQELLTADRMVGVGPGNILPMHSYPSTNGQSYQPWLYLDPPKGSDESLRKNIQAIREEVDRDTAMIKPAGSRAMGSGTVSQSGTSKEIDNEALHDRLSAVAAMLQEAEQRLAVLVVAVSGSLPGKSAARLFVPPQQGAAEQVTIRYPKVFSLRSAEEVAGLLGEFQTGLANSGDAPLCESMMLQELFHKTLPGHTDSLYAQTDAEITAAVDKKSQEKEQARQLAAEAAAAALVAIDRPAGLTPGSYLPEPETASGE